MWMEKLIDISSYPIINVLDILLQDKTTKKNIIWATDTYEVLGEGFTDKSQMSRQAILRQSELICPRIQKSQEAQLDRTRKKAEVFTPAWLCNKMNNHCDEDWFGRTNVFNCEKEDNTWTATEENISFASEKQWQNYVDSRRLEITCGEAPYLVSRYDAATGEVISSLRHRIGVLDRKLRIVNENTKSYDEWIKWTVRAFEACYGYEYQGDNILIARVNLLLSFVDYYKERWDEEPDEGLLLQLANKIAWNIWQMDGLKDTVPLGKPFEEFHQLSIFELFGTGVANEHQAMQSVVYNWRGKSSLKFAELKERGAMGKKLFDYVIGNPPYQEETESDSTRKPPIYNAFMDACYEIASATELITPARFLFDAGYTPKAWNEKMLNDDHFKVLLYEHDSAKVFPNTDIKGGVIISYRDENKEFGAIEIFTKYSELTAILQKVRKRSDVFLDEIISSPLSYKVSDCMLREHPDSVGRLRTSAFSKLSDIFYEENPFDGHEYIGMIGLLDGKRVKRYVRKDYIIDGSNLLNKYSLLVAKASGTGTFGETLSEFSVAEPGVAYTQTFIGIGKCDTQYEVDNIAKYIKCKFARAMLGVLKITQDCPGPKWKYVPIQDFSASSDIDWSQPISVINRQLYAKYELSNDEISFIETHVKEMA